MKSTFSYIGLAMLILNSLLGLVLSTYAPFNWMLNDGVIVVNTMLFSFLATSKIKDGFKFGLTFGFAVFGATEFLFGLFMQNYFVDNLILVFMSIIFILHVGIFIFVRSINKFA